MKAYKIELLVLDFDGLGESEIKNVIQNTKYPNYCISPYLMATEEKEIDWSDDHPLNNINTQKQAFNELFKQNI